MNSGIENPEHATLFFSTHAGICSQAGLGWSGEALRIGAIAEHDRVMTTRVSIAMRVPTRRPWICL
jgi:hypothetical protein